MKIKRIHKIVQMAKYVVWGMWLQILCFTFLFASEGLSQVESLKDIKVSVSFESTPLVRIFDDLSLKSNLNFYYKRELVENKNLTYFNRNVSLEKVLLDISQKTGLGFKRINETIHVIEVPKNEKNKVTEEFTVGQSRNINGKILSSEDNLPLPGVNVIEKGTSNGTITSVDGIYSLQVSEGATLVFSSVGYTTEEAEVGSRSVIDLIMTPDIRQLQEIVVVGYGEQRKESIVGAISQTNNETLERRGGVTNISSALSGQIPGVTVLETTGEPGVNDPTILIRGKSTWNNSYPLILVDGVERKMNDIDVSEVESISVLKDASATAVFGVKGANGVILITTKRGKTGKANLSMGANMSIKSISKIFTAVDAFEARSWINEAIEREVVTNEDSWKYFTPYEHLLYYKRPQQEEYKYIFPNIDWHDEVLKDFAKTYRVNMNVSGGTKSARYFGSLAYINEEDILASGYNHVKRYDPGYTYNRFNFRGNLDFDLTKTTKLGVNLSGFTGVKKETYAYQARWIYTAIYDLAPDLFPPRHADGSYGINPALSSNAVNPIAILNEAGVRRNQRSLINGDFNLKQGLDFVTNGLSVTGKASYDIYFTSSGPNILDGGNQGQVLYKYLDPSILYAENARDSLNAIQYYLGGTSWLINEFDFVNQPWKISPLAVNNSGLSRVLFYQLSLNYARKFGVHDFSGLFLFNRRENATGPEFRHYREDWVGRLTYSFDNKYFLETNGAYNGSENFGPGYRFGFFPSAAVGWMVSEESFLNYNWLDKLKLRGSVGKVGSDAIGGDRWPYIGSFLYGGTDMRALFTNPSARDILSPYFIYREGTIPNPNLHWENSLKRNIGVELGFFNNSVALSIDAFKDNWSNIYIRGNDRSVPDFFGAPPVAINYGKTETRGYEIELNLKKHYNNGLMTWADFNMTRAKDKILQYEDPELLNAYQKRTGYQIGQTRIQIRDGFINNWDDAFASVEWDNNRHKMPGDWGLIDYNGDGVINTNDNVPFGYPDRPQNTYSSVLGLNYKNFTFMVQFYGVKNIHRRVAFRYPGANQNTVSEYFRDFWTPENTSAFYRAPRFLTGPTQGSGISEGDFVIWDGSFLRLKTAEISYKLKSFKTADVKIYVNGNNLFFWSDLPHDQETGSYDEYDAYPMFKQYNLGLNITF